MEGVGKGEGILLRSGLQECAEGENTSPSTVGEETRG